VLLAEGLIHRELQLSIVMYPSQSHFPQLIGISSHPYPFTVIPARLSGSIRMFSISMSYSRSSHYMPLPSCMSLFCSFVKPHTLHAHCDLE
jgi:hypothetical protein